MGIVKKAKELRRKNVTNENNKLINNSPYAPYGDIMVRGMSPRNALEGKIKYSLPTRSNLNEMQIQRNIKNQKSNARPWDGQLSPDRKEIFYRDGTSERLDARPIKGGREALYPDGTTEIMYPERTKRRRAR
jgi:hypothetical protein